MSQKLTSRERDSIERSRLWLGELYTLKDEYRNSLPKADSNFSRIEPEQYVSVIEVFWGFRSEPRNSSAGSW
jgi:hypothetical protein